MVTANFQNRLFASSRNLERDWQLGSSALRGGIS
jgi:hypothetical protein